MMLPIKLKLALLEMTGSITSVNVYAYTGQIFICDAPGTTPMIPRNYHYGTNTEIAKLQLASLFQYRNYPKKLVYIQIRHPIQTVTIQKIYT